MTASRTYVYKISMENHRPSQGRPKPTARNKMMDLLARREHSEKEIRQKLQNSYSPEEIEQAIEVGKANKWIPADDFAAQALAEKTAADLRRKGKGAEYINQYLEEKGLPKVSFNSSEELDKALSLVKNKFLDFEHLKSLSEEEQDKIKAKMGRFLAARGFDMEIVGKVIDGKE